MVLVQGICHQFGSITKHKIWQIQRLLAARDHGMIVMTTHIVIFYFTVIFLKQRQHRFDQVGLINTHGTTGIKLTFCHINIRYIYARYYLIAHYIASIFKR